MNRQITVEELLRDREETLGLENLSRTADLNRPITHPDPASPGLALAGFTERVVSGRVQVFGETEMAYLDSLDGPTIEKRLGHLFSHDVPVVFVTKDLEVKKWFLSTAEKYAIPVFRTSMGTGQFFQRLNPYLEAALSPTVSLHGSLADVYGVGLLFVGESGIGKSECVLDLVERGHRLVADDLVFATRRGYDIIIGHGHEVQRHHMEIRGIGIIDVKALFGIRAIRQQKRIEVVVQLEAWDDSQEYSRTGLERETTDILGVPLPKVTVPLNPGKNITVISEVVAMNHLLKYAGVDPAQEFDQKLREAMKPVREYLEQDYE
ncbi:MAG: HPr(Ser) kinase/phosphatase [Gemmatimonadetes bacterium]|nr:HPr(Ser) kinase/phosphatase [Gemmatimonadota bacterium]NNM07182.1 HPr(Ser) kinase/phosphatase [Gemmatimonadota bacterium]